MTAHRLTQKYHTYFKEVDLFGKFKEIILLFQFKLWQLTIYLYEILYDDLYSENVQT